jgi:uncharacterized protein
MSSPVTLEVPLAVEISSATLRPDREFPGEVLAGDPEMSVQVIWESADGQQSRGIWEVRPGKFTWLFDVDDFFVVVSGRATVELDDGGVLEMVPGTVAIFKPGDQTTWTVHETIRKGFHSGGSPAAPAV